MTAQAHSWSHANDVRSTRAIQRRAVFLAAIESGLNRKRAAHRAAISERTARRYLSLHRKQECA